MQHQSFHDRLEELPEILGMRWIDIVRKLDMTTDALQQIRCCDNAYTTTVDTIAKGLGLIPVILYKERHPESLGIEDFLRGEFVDNYTGRVIAKRRQEKEMKHEDVAKQAGRIQWKKMVINFENGGVGMTKNLERIYQVLDVVPQYLVQPRIKPATSARVEPLIVQAYEVPPSKSKVQNRTITSQ